MSNRRVWATPVLSLWEISDALSALRVSHSITATSTTRRTKVVDMKMPQPRWVHLTDDVRGLKRNAVNFISASYSELDLTNFPIFPEGDLQEVLKEMLVKSQSRPVTIRTITYMEYVDIVAKPSLLNKIQTALYRIQPYSLRKDTQAAVLAYLNSRISEKLILGLLKRSHKTEGLVELIVKARTLRDAAYRTRKETVEAVAASTGIPTFELYYINKSKQ